MSGRSGERTGGFVQVVVLLLVEGEGFWRTFLQQFFEGVISFGEVLDKTAVDVTSN